MSTAQVAQANLAAPFPLEVVGFKPQATNTDKTKALIATYIDARAVVSRLDEVFPLAWEDVYAVQEHTNNRLTIECKLTVRLADGASVTRVDVGESYNPDSAVGASRWKSAVSDAFKRAAVKFGIGAYLYSIDGEWVEVQKAGNSVRMTPRGLKQAETAYTKAVKALGLDKVGERSQGQIDEAVEPEKPRQETTVDDGPPPLTDADVERSEEAAAAHAELQHPDSQAERNKPHEVRKLHSHEASRLHAALGAIGWDQSTEHHAIASHRFGREVTSFTQLTIQESVELKGYAERQMEKRKAKVAA